ncbi:hypothetical protein PJE062_624 [Pseudovibrio sp. JE062]|nr:hypothetical protein PJE062_624 [Pseudovibrio sp. JE062]
MLLLVYAHEARDAGYRPQTRLIHAEAETILAETTRCDDCM